MPVIGITGNIISFIVLMRPNIRNTSLSAYLANISIMDTTALFIMVLEFYNSRLFAYGFIQGDFFCKTRHVLKYTALISSAWLLVGVTTERFVAVCFPFKASSFLKVTTARWISAGIVIVIFLVNCYGFWMWKVINNRCTTVNPQMYGMYLRYVTIFASLFYTYMPSAIICVLNAMILRHLYVNSKRLRNARHTVGHKGKDKGAKVTKMILVATFAYMFCTIPFASFNTLMYFGVLRLDRHLSGFIQFWLQFLVSANHSCNFLIYVFSGTKFRDELSKLCRCSKKKI